MAANIASIASEPAAGFESLLTLVMAAPMAMAAYDAEGRFVNGNASFKSLVPQNEHNQAILEEARRLGPSLADRCRAGETVRPPPLVVRAEDGSTRCIRFMFGPWTNGGPEMVGLISQAWDATEDEECRINLKRYEERLEVALAIDRIQIKEINVKTMEQFISGPDDMEVLTRRTDQRFTHVHPEDRDRVMAAVQAVAADPVGNPGPLCLEFRHNSDTPIWLSSISTRSLDANGKTERVILVTQDVTERVLKRKEVETLAYTDALTGLPNRARFQLEFKQAAEAAAAAGTLLGLIMVDVDHFKQINDTLGHDAGDALLRELAQQMRRAFRSSDVVARLGGDEFAILLKDVMSEEDVARPLAALRQALAVPLQHLGQGFRVMTSIGAAIHDDPEKDPISLMKNADIALYKAKAEGRDRIVMFRPEMGAQIEKRLELLREVREAIQRNEFVLYYQPVVDTGLGKVDGFEALMRWNHPQKGVLTPTYFMSAFEDQELSLQLGEFAIDSVVKQMRLWIDEGAEFGRISVNLSASQFRSGHLGRDILDKLAAYDVPPTRLTVEVTENVSMGWGAEAVGQTVRELHAKGVGIALDDFGTGYASLVNLRQFPIDRLKIDKSFVQNTADEAIVRAVINLGASMGMQVVAEGVEEDEQLRALSEYGCDHIQGFHFARPMPAEAVGGYLRGFTMQPGVETAA